MLKVVVNYAGEKPTAVTEIDGKEVQLSVVNAKKPGEYWVNLKKLGCARSFVTVKKERAKDNIEEIEVDETSARTVSATKSSGRKKSFLVTTGNIADFLTEDKAKAALTKLVEMATAEANRQFDEYKANQPVKEKKAMSDEDKAKLYEAKLEALKKKIAANKTATPEAEAAATTAKSDKA